MIKGRDSFVMPFFIYCAAVSEVVIAMDSFKGCLSSSEANDAVACAVRRLGAESYQLTVSDGGDGMLEAFAPVLGARLVKVSCHDALMRQCTAFIGISGDTAIIETAQSAGLTLIEPELRNPVRATSYGVGELIAESVRRGCRHLLVGLGGSATSDCGIGMLRALVDNLSPGGTVDDLQLSGLSVTIASDVTNPLLGSNGAAAVFSPQKGATPDMVRKIEHRAETFARIGKLHCGKDESETPGAGAAGGLGYAFLQYFNAKIESGADLLLRLAHFDDQLRDASVVITGEGKSDCQTLMGKLPFHILKHAMRAGVPVMLLSGVISDADALEKAGFSLVSSINHFLNNGENPMDREIAKRNLELSVGKYVPKFIG